MAAATRYWRVRLRTNASVTNVQCPIIALELYDSGQNLLNGSATVSCTESDDLVTYPIANLSDENDATVCSFHYPGTLIYDTGSDIDFDFGVGNSELVDYLTIQLDATPIRAEGVVSNTALTIQIFNSDDGTTWYEQAWHKAGTISSRNVDVSVTTHYSSVSHNIPDITVQSGIGGIFGIVSEDGVALPNRPVYLYDRLTMEVVYQTTTDQNGGYKFTGINENKDWLVLSVDPTGPPYKNAIVYDRVIPVNALAGANVSDNAFFQLRYQDPELVQAWGVRDTAADPLGIQDYKSLMSGTGSNLVRYELLKQPHTLEVAEPLGDGQSLQFSRLKTDTNNNDQRGLSVRNEGVLNNINLEGDTSNVSPFAMEIIVRTPGGTSPTEEDDMYFVVSGSTDIDDLDTTRYDIGSATYGPARGPTIEILYTGVINCRMCLGGYTAGLGLDVIRATGTHVPGTITHIIMSWEENNVIRLFVNGVLQDEQPITGRSFVTALGRYNSQIAWDLYNWNVNHSGRSGNVRRYKDTYLSDGKGYWNNYVHGGWGGAVGALFTYRKLIDATYAAELYDSYANSATKVVPPIYSGYAGVVCTDNPSWYYRCNETGSYPGNFNVDVAKSSHGPRATPATLGGSLTYQQTGFVPGGSSFGLGTDGRVMPDIGTHYNSEFTLECFVNADFTNTATTYLPIYVIYNNSTPPFYIQLSAGAPAAYIRDQNGTTSLYACTSVNGMTKLADAEDLHVVVRYDPFSRVDGAGSIWVNGVKEWTFLAPHPIRIHDELRWMGILCEPYSSGPSFRNFTASARIAEIAYYAYPLEDARIQAHYLAKDT